MTENPLDGLETLGSPLDKTVRKDDVETLIKDNYIHKDKLEEARICASCKGKKTIPNVHFEICAKSKEGTYYGFTDCNEAMEKGNLRQQTDCYVCKNREVVNCHRCEGSGTEDSTSFFLNRLQELLKSEEGG